MLPFILDNLLANLDSSGILPGELRVFLGWVELVHAGEAAVLQSRM